MDCLGLDCESIYAAVVNGGGWIHMTVKRRRNGGRSLHTAHLHCPRASHHGLMLHTGVYIANILPGSPAAREGSLAVGDRVLNVCDDHSCHVCWAAFLHSGTLLCIIGLCAYGYVQYMVICLLYICAVNLTREPSSP